MLGGETDAIHVEAKRVAARGDENGADGEEANEKRSEIGRAKIGGIEAADVEEAEIAASEGGDIEQDEDCAKDPFARETATRKQSHLRQRHRGTSDRCRT